MHEDFYSAATTVALVYLLGGVFLMHWVMSHFGSSRWWLLLVLQALLVFPTLFVIVISLSVLSGTAQDTAGWRQAVILLVFVQISGGSAGLFAQAASVKIERATTPRAPDGSN